MSKITLAELTAESVELLPARDTLFFGSNWSSVNAYAHQTATAVNALTLFSVANAQNGQFISVSQ